MQQLKEGAEGKQGKEGGGQEDPLQSHPSSPWNRRLAQRQPAEGALAAHFCSHDKAVA